MSDILDRITKIDNILGEISSKIDGLSNQLALIAGVPAKVSVTPFTIPINLEQLVASLYRAGKITGYGGFFSATLNPAESYEITIPVSSGYYMIPIEFIATPDPDHALILSIDADGQPMFYDDDMVSGIYEEPVNYITDFRFITVLTEYMRVTITNKTTTDTAYINMRLAWAEIRAAEWEKIMDKYYEPIKRWLIE